MLELKLYVVQESQKSIVLIEKLKRILEEEFKDQYSLEIIDAMKNMEMMEQDRIMATPTLIKCSPEPGRRIIGDLNEKEKVFLGLGLSTH